MEYLKLGEVFKINVNNKMIYLKIEPNNSIGACDNCYFYENGKPCNKATNCDFIDKKYNTNIIFKQVNPIEIVYIVFSERFDKFIKRIGIYPTEEDAKKTVEELNRYYRDFAHYYEAIEYFPYGIITDIKEVKIN